MKHLLVGVVLTLFLVANLFLIENMFAGYNPYTGIPSLIYIILVISFISYGNMRK